MEKNHFCRNYMVDAFSYGSIAFIFYSVWIFRCIPGWSVFASRIALVEIVLVSLLFGYMKIFRRSSATGSVIKALMFAMGFYTYIAYRSFLGRFGEIICHITGILILLCGFLIMFQRVKSRRHTRMQILGRKILKWMSISVSIFGAGMLVLNLYFMAHFLLTGSIIAKTRLEIADNHNKVTVEENMDAIHHLHPDCWNSMTIMEKLSTLQVVADIESDILGNSNRLTVGAEAMNDNTLAYYRYQNQSIIFNLDHLDNDSVLETLDSCCHEVYHAYQHSLVELYNGIDEKYRDLQIFEEAIQYNEEFSHYEKGKNNFYDYYNQLCEAKARDYAQEAIRKYVDALMLTS